MSLDGGNALTAAPALDAPALHQQLLEAVRESIYVVDRAQRILYVNRALEEASDMAAAAFVGRTSAEMFPSLHAQGLGDLIDRALAGERADAPRLPFRDARSGAEGWLSLRVSPLRAPGGGVPGAIVASRDITERTRLEEALAASKNHLRAILESEPECVKLTARDGSLLHMNPAGLTMIEADSAADVLGRNLCDFVLPADREAFAALSARVFEGDTASLEFTIVGLKGTARRVETYAAPLRDASGQTVAAVAVTRDVTDRRLLEAQLRHSQKLESLGQLAGGIAHDFNNILLIVSGNSELALKHLPADHPAAELIAEVYEAAGRGASLTRQLLAFSRRQMLEPRTIDVNALVAETEKMLRRLMGEDIELATHLDPAAHEVTADAGNLVQVLLNLAVNARDAMPARGGRVTIETANVDGAAVRQAHPDAGAGPYLRLSLIDTGCGMTPHGQAERRPYRDRERARPRHDGDDLPAGGRGARPPGPRRAP
jgi:PAS domain S-box-containing protein